MTTQCKLPVDHVGILARSIEDLTTAYQKLGFNIIGPAPLVAVDKEGESKSLGQSSAHIMFADTYIELTTVTDPAPPHHHLYRFLSGPFGLRLIILRTDDIDQITEMSATSVQKASREILYGEPGTAYFRWLSLPDEIYEEALVGFVEHQTPDKVFQSCVAKHTNTAVGFSYLILRGDQIPKRYLDLKSEDGISLEARSAQDIEQELGLEPKNHAPFVAIGILVQNIKECEKNLINNNVDYHKKQGALCVSPKDAAGIALYFHQA